MVEIDGDGVVHEIPAVNDGGRWAGVPSLPVHNVPSPLGQQLPPRPPLPVRIAWSRRELSQRFAAIAAELEAVQNLAGAMSNGVLTDHPAQASLAASLQAASRHAESYYRSLGKALGALEV